MLGTKLGKINLKNPLILASGIIGVSGSSMCYCAENGAGALTTKSASRKPRAGHPNPTIITPAIWFNSSTNFTADDKNILLMITPSIENNTENPKTKNTEFKIIFVLLIVIILEPFF